jgi:hypothetical protein
MANISEINIIPAPTKIGPATLRLFFYPKSSASLGDI